MTPRVSPAPQDSKKRRVLSARRVALLATTIAGLGVAALVVAPGLNLPGGYPSALAQNLTEQAHKLAAPVGFADIVAKVKPAVISVRVSVDAGRPRASRQRRRCRSRRAVRRFFRALRHAGRHAATACARPAAPVVTGQGSGFFISADGYAVTNNHVVDKAEERPGHHRRRQDPRRPR